MGNIFKKESEVYKENQLLKLQIEDLKKQNNNFRRILEDKAEANNEKQLDQFYKNLNTSIEGYVDEMLEDDEINSVIPDYIEKKIYKNVFTLVLKLMKNFTDSASISFLDQEITFNLRSKNHQNKM